MPGDLIGADELASFCLGGTRWNLELKKRFGDPKFLEQYGYKVYSQNDEDGIIAEIFRRIGTTNKTFIEFGVENGLECNSHYLLFSGWNGLWMDGGKENISDMQRKFKTPIENEQLKVKRAFITKDNINELISEAGISGEIDLLSIDIDGNDWHVLEAVDAVSPRVVIIEYNAKLPPDCEWVMQYEADYCWNTLRGGDRHGASLRSMELLANKKGFNLVGTSISGANAFFVRKDLTDGKFALPASSENLYNPCRFNFMHFVSGHPANDCLLNVYSKQERRNALLDEARELGFVAVDGFHPAEYKQGKFTIQWMSAFSARLYVSTESGDRQIKLLYSCGLSESKYEGFLLSACVENRQVLSDMQVMSVGELVLPLEATDCGLTCVDIEITRVWRPCDELESADNRTLGIGFQKVTVE